MSARRFEDMFRPAGEVWSVFGWASSVLTLLIARPPLWPILILIPVALMFTRINDVKKLMGFRAAISVARMRSLTLKEMLTRSRAMRQKKELLSIGRGFTWGQSHIETAVQVLNRNSNELPDVPVWIKQEASRLALIPKEKMGFADRIKNAAVSGIFPKGSRPVLDSDIGAAWIHGIGVAEEADIGIPFSALPGHTLITGTTRAGKTRLYEALTAQIVDMGSALIVIDPKKDIDGYFGPT